MRITRSGISTLEYNRPAVWPEYIQPACGQTIAIARRLGVVGRTSLSSAASTSAAVAG
jgi:hypothetical protein